SAASLLQYVMTRLGATDDLGPNRMVGIKTKATLASDDAWRAGHAAAQPALLATAVTGPALALPLVAWRIAAGSDASLVLTVASGVAAAVVLVLFGAAVVRANRAARG